MLKLSVDNGCNAAWNALLKIMVNFFKRWCSIELELVGLLVLTWCKLWFSLVPCCEIYRYGGGDPKSHSS